VNCIYYGHSHPSSTTTTGHGRLRRYYTVLYCTAAIRRQYAVRKYAESLSQAFLYDTTLTRAVSVDRMKNACEAAPFIVFQAGGKGVACGGGGRTETHGLTAGEKNRYFRRFYILGFFVHLEAFFDNLDKIFTPLQNPSHLFIPYKIVSFGVGKFCRLMQTNRTFIRPYPRNGWSYTELKLCVKVVLGGGYLGT